MAARPYWSLPALGRRWGKDRKTVRYYVLTGILAADREEQGSGFAYRVTNKERARFERYVLPNLRPGRKASK
jgi:hypothetical protein